MTRAAQPLRLDAPGSPDVSRYTPRVTSIRTRLGQGALALAVCAALSVVHTWPLASDPATLSRVDNKDMVLNAWAITWVARALVTSPSRVLDGNIFHPEAHTVAFSDPIVVPGALSVPVRAAGAGPVLTYNLSLLIGYALSAWAMQWLAWRWTRHLGASLVAGSLFAFNAHSLVSMGHIQAIHAYGLPLLLLGLDGLCRPDRRRLGDGLLVGAATILLALTSGYLAIFGIVTGLVVVAVRWRELWQAPWRPLIAAVVAGVVLLAMPLVPLMRVYAEVRETHGLERSLDLVAALSANGAAYLATPARIHESWARQVYTTQSPRDSLFPGLVALALAGVGLLTLGSRSAGASTSASSPLGSGHENSSTTRARTRVALGLVAIGVLLSVGPATPIYSWFYSTIPFASGVRAASRFGVLYLTGLAMLAAYGVVVIARRWPAMGSATALVAFLAVNVEAYRGPVPYVLTPPPSPVYATLAELPDGVVAEMPFWWRQVDVPRNANYMLASTAHWKPLLNGYSGFTPASYRKRADILWYFPFRPASFDELDRADVRYLVLHLVEYGSQRREALDLIEASGRWRVLQRTDDTVLYERTN